MLVIADGKRTGQNVTLSVVHIVLGNNQTTQETDVKQQ